MIFIDIHRCNGISNLFRLFLRFTQSIDMIINPLRVTLVNHNFWETLDNHCVCVYVLDKTCFYFHFIHFFLLFSQAASKAISISFSLFTFPRSLYLVLIRSTWNHDSAVRLPAALNKRWTWNVFYCRCWTKWIWKDELCFKNRPKKASKEPPYILKLGADKYTIWKILLNDL